eukprot:Pompholyxophrys_punicea_v1_NODE_57_length_4146_cov_6.766521.p3 type:complete len:221 gc:universal NODE_57_length_4146_cov_6.766521:2171-2833(+)
MSDPTLFKVEAFEGLQTKYEQEKYFHEEFSSEDPIPVRLGSGRLETGNVSRKGSYGIKKLISNKTFFEDYNTIKRNPDGDIRDVSDGSVYSNHPVFKNYPNAAQVLLYYDDVEITNPLSSYVHKLGFFYAQLTNTSPQYRSKLSMIQLIAVARTEHLRNNENGIEKLLENFITTMIDLGLYDGVVINPDLNLHGALIAFIADTLASQYIAVDLKSLWAVL